MNTLEQDALEVLRLVRSYKNLFAPINKIPHDVLSLLPGYYDEDRIGQNLITLTHVCRGWRGIFTSRSSLWTRLDFTNVDKTRAYIERSRSSPLEIHLRDDKNPSYFDDAFSLVIPHLRRLKSLAIYVDVPPGLLKHFFCQTPLLEELDISFLHSHSSALDRTLFDGDLSSLRKLTLTGAITITHLPWNNMKNLQVLNLVSWSPVHSITQLLDFFESAPLLHTIELDDSIPDSSDAPPQRIVPLPHLRALTINSIPPHSTLLNHLCVPTGASLVLVFWFGDEEESLLPDYLSGASGNLKILSNITAINVCFGSEKCVRLSGPSGSLRLLAHRWDGGTDSHTADCRILHSLEPSILSKAQRLAVSEYRHSYQTEGSPIFQCVSSMNNLRVLVLTNCDNLPFILTLDPEENPSKLVLCHNLEELVLHIMRQDQFHLEHLISMVKSRASRGAKLSSITIVGLDELAPGRQVFKLREHVTCVTYMVDDVPPAWDHIPGESGDKNK